MKKLLLASLLMVCSCDQKPVTTSEPGVTYLQTRDITIAGKIFKLEVADEDHEQETGLMRRRQMPADHGMIFVFPDAQERSFWMKNTYLPLDIIYVRPDGTVVSVKPMYPLELNPVPSEGKAQYAIELNQGVCAKIGIKAGDHIALPADLSAGVK